MDVPFSFELSSAVPRGVIGNPNGVTVLDSDTNLIPPPDYYPVVPCLITGITITGDESTTTAPCSLILHEETGAVDTVLWSTGATEATGSGLVDDLGEGIPVALGPTAVLCVLYDAADGASNIKGSVTLVVPSGTAAQMQAAIAATLTPFILDEDGGIVLDDADDEIEQE